jgi:hypothetical protein
MRFRSVNRIVSTFAALTLVCFVAFPRSAVDAAPRIVDLPQLGPGSGSGVVFTDVLQQASPWLSAAGGPLALDESGNLAGLAPGQSAERVVFQSENYPAGDYELEWTGRATFAVSGGDLLPGGGPNVAIVRVRPNDGSGLRLRLLTTDAQNPVRNVRLFLPGYGRAGASTFAPAFVRSVEGADVVRFAKWARVDSFASAAVWPLRPSPDRPTQALPSGAAFEDEILLANRTGANPWISIPAGATDGYVAGEARLLQQTLDPRLHVVVEYASPAMFVQGSPTNRWALMAARNLHLPAVDAQSAARAWYDRRSAQVMAIFRRAFGDQAARVVAADSTAMLALHNVGANPNALLQPGDDATPAVNEHIPAHMPAFRPGVAGAPHARSPLDLEGRTGVVIGLGVPLANANPAREGHVLATKPAGRTLTLDAHADRTERTARIYVVADRTRATLTATLEGKRYQSASLGNATGSRTGVWTIVYRARASDEKLHILITPSSDAGTVTVRAAVAAPHDLRGKRNASPSDEPLYHNDLLRTGWNQNETTLTTANVNASSFGQIGTLTVDGNVLAQPLYVANLTIGSESHNVLIVATEHDSVYEFDADTGVELNKVSLGAAATSRSIGCSDITPEYGITSTPVIDRASNKLFVVAVSEPKKNQFHVTLHALNLQTLADATTPVDIDPSVTLSNGENVGFDPRNQHVRPGLVWANNALYVGVGSHCDNNAGDIVGWVLKYDANLNSVAAFPTIEDHTRYLLSSVWQSGFAPAVSAKGDLYFAIGNGAFDASTGGHDYGESAVRLASDLSGVTSFFTPHEWKHLNAQDEDFGSGGAMLLPTQQSTSHPNVLVAQGKSSKIYLLDASSLGGLSATDSGALQITKPSGYGVWGGPTYYSGPTGQFVYYQAGGDVLRAYAVGENAQGVPQLTFSSGGSSYAGYGGSTPVVSSNGQTAGTGIVWEVERGNKTLTLEAYDATNLTNLLFSAKAGTWPKSNGFETLLVANGKVYVPGENAVTVFGLK